jgi:predicted membrane channel-forming protein YqfA (hemolysin III family)
MENPDEFVRVFYFVSMALLERFWNQWIRPVLWLLFFVVSIQLIVAVLENKGTALSMFLGTVMPFYSLGKFYFFFKQDRKEGLRSSLRIFHWISLLVFIPGFWLVLFKAQLPFGVVLVSVLFLDELLNFAEDEKK